MIRSLLRRKFIQDTLTLQAGKIGMILLSLISSLLVWRLMGPQRFGEFALAQSFLVVWQTLDLTGVGTSTSIRLALAIGARNESAVLDLMAFYVKISTLVNVGLTLLIALVGTSVAARLYNGDTRIVALAVWLSVGTIADELYGLVIISLQSRRSMRSLALMQTANQLVLTVCQIVAVLISPTPESLVAARVIYSYSTLAMAFVVFQRTRTQGSIHYPPLRAIFARARTVSPRPYWQFGVANAVDKNLAALFIQIPLQLVGIFVGARAVGYLNLAMSGIAQTSVLTSAVLDNMQAVVPQAVGRRDFAGLWRSFQRVLVVLALGGIVFYGALVLVAPFVIPPILGARWIPAVPPLIALSVYGAVTTFGGVFSPLYRAFNLMRRIIAVKLFTLALLALPAALLASSLMHPSGADFGLATVAVFDPAVGRSGALMGAWLIDALYIVSITLTAAVTLPELRKKARAA